MTVVEQIRTDANANKREAGMMAAVGAQGVGKTYENMYVIKDYVTDNIETKVRGRKCLIFDTNGEYTEEQFAENGIPNFKAARIAISDIEAWSRNPNIVECRRIDAKNLGIKEKKKFLEYILNVFVNGMFVLEDINTYILSVTHMEEVVGKIVSLRHRAVDVLISYQSARAVEPRIWQNSRWVRMHYQADSVADIKNKVTNPTMFRIAQLIVNKKYFNGDERTFLYIHNIKKNKIEGPFNKLEFSEACKSYLNENKKYVKEFQAANNCDTDQAILGQTNYYFKQYYGNAA